MLPYFPQIFANKAIKYYLVTLGIVLVLFNSHTMPLKWIIFGIIEVVGFFMLSKNYTTKWKDADIAIFSKRLFWTAFSLRAAWVIFSYFFYIHIFCKQVSLSNSRLPMQWVIMKVLCGLGIAVGMISGTISLEKAPQYQTPVILLILLLFIDFYPLSW